MTTCYKCKGIGTIGTRQGHMRCHICKGAGEIQSLQCSAGESFICPYKYDVICQAPPGVICRYQMQVITNGSLSRCRSPFL